MGCHGKGGLIRSDDLMTRRLESDGEHGTLRADRTLSLDEERLLRRYGFCSAIGIHSQLQVLSSFGRTLL